MRTQGRGSPASTDLTERNSNGGAGDRNARSHLAVIERIALAAFPKDAEARKQALAEMRKVLDSYAAFRKERKARNGG